MTETALLRALQEGRVSVKVLAPSDPEIDGEDITEMVTHLLRACADEWGLD